VDEEQRRRAGIAAIIDEDPRAVDADQPSWQV
jgi:hypothetical protein